MRILGWITFILGIMLGVLLLMAKLGGGDISWQALIIAGALVLTGWRLKSAAVGLVKAPAVAAPVSDGARSNSAAYVAAAPAVVSPTVELPLTPSAAGAIRAAMLASRRLFVKVIVGIDLFFLVLGVVLSFAAPAPGSHVSFGFLAIMGIVSMGFTLLVGLIWVLQTGRPASRDLREPTYLRTAGPLEVVAISGGYILRLADRGFTPPKTAAIPVLRKLDWATVDHSRHAHVILGVWDQAGNNVFLAAGYQPAPPIPVCG